MRRGRETTEYRMALYASMVGGAATFFSGVMAYVVEPAWVGVALAGIAGVVGGSVVVGYVVSRSGLKKGEEAAAGEVRKAEVMAEPMRAAVKPTSRVV